MEVDQMLIAAIIVLSSAACLAAEPSTVTSTLTPGTRAAFILEMQAIDAAMDRIHTALVTGDHATVSAEANAIHDSFILAQALSDEQRTEIGALPQEFLGADSTFHRLAGRLVQAGETHDSQAERVWYDEMTRACLACHEVFAAGRFPGLTAEAAEGDHASH